MNEKIQEAYLKREEAYDFPYPDDGIDKVEMMDIAKTFYMVGVRDLLSSPEVQGLIEALDQISDIAHPYNNNVIHSWETVMNLSKQALSHFEHTEEDCQECGGDGHIDWGNVAPPNYHPPLKIEPCPNPNCQDGKIRRWKIKD